MKKSILTVFVLAAVLTGCGGGSSNSKSGGLKKNEYLGSLPAIYADFQSAKKGDEAKIEKLQETGNFEKMAKEAAKIEKEAGEREAKLEADLKAEMGKIAGKDIPFTCSDAFKKLNCEVIYVKFSDHSTPGIVASIVAKNDFEVGIKENNTDDYSRIYYKIVAKDGSTIAKYDFFLMNVAWGKSKSFTKGQSLQFEGKDAQGWWAISKNPEKWVDFAGIEFITEEE